MHEGSFTAAHGQVCVAVQGWTCTQVFEGHSHYVMQVVFNPKDTNTFASASLDRTVKVFPGSHLPPSVIVYTAKRWSSISQSQAVLLCA